MPVPAYDSNFEETRQGMANAANGIQSYNQDDLNAAMAVSGNDAVLDYLGKQVKSDSQHAYILQKDAQNFNSAEAQKNRDWQEEMSNSSWQRGVKDMIAAGINPALAYSQGGASTPSGSQASSAIGHASSGSGASRVLSGLFNTAIATAGGVFGKALGAKIGASAAADRLSDKLEHDLVKTELVEASKDSRNLNSNSTRERIANERLKFDIHKWNTYQLDY